MARQRDPQQGRLTRAFFARPVLEVAPELLGCTVSHAGVTLRLTEVEAYDGSNDPGSHAFRGQTPRTADEVRAPVHPVGEVDVEPARLAEHHCGATGEASAVLLRAGEVVEGLDVARTRRAGVADRDLARGPARLAMTLALTRDQNGIDTVAPDSALVMRRVPSRSPGLPGASRPVVRTGPRVGVSGSGGDVAAYPWRFWLEGEATVSAYRPGKVRPPKPAAGSGDP